MAMPGVVLLRKPRWQRRRKRRRPGSALQILNQARSRERVENAAERAVQVLQHRDDRGDGRNVCRVRVVFAVDTAVAA